MGLFTSLLSKAAKGGAVKKIAGLGFLGSMLRKKKKKKKKGSVSAKAKMMGKNYGRKK